MYLINMPKYLVAMTFLWWSLHFVFSNWKNLGDFCLRSQDFINVPMKDENTIVLFKISGKVVLGVNMSGN